MRIADSKREIYRLWTTKIPVASGPIEMVGYQDGAWVHLAFVRRAIRGPCESAMLWLLPGEFCRRSVPGGRSESMEDLAKEIERFMTAPIGVLVALRQHPAVFGKIVFGGGKDQESMLTEQCTKDRVERSSECVVKQILSDLDIKGVLLQYPPDLPDKVVSFCCPRMLEANP